MGKKIKKVIVLIIIFLFTFLGTKLWIIPWLIEKLPIENTEENSQIITMFNLIWSFIVTNGIELFKMILSSISEKRNSIPQISIWSKVVSCVSKSNRKHNMPEVKVGRGNVFIYVYSSIKNIGEKTILECAINSTNLNIGAIESGNFKDFCFKVYKNEDENFEERYLITVSLEDEENDFYLQELYLLIDREEQIANIIKKSELKRRRKSHENNKKN